MIKSNSLLLSAPILSFLPQNNFS